MSCLKRFFEDRNYAIAWGIFGVFVVSGLLSLFLLVKVVDGVMDLGVNDNMYYNSISTDGEGEVVTVPDVATFTFSVIETAESVEAAQNIASQKNNNVLDYLKEQGIEDKDVKTISYNVSPRYEWIQGPCNEFRCEGGEQNLVGYQVSQSVSVKVRDTEKAGEILSGIGSFGVSNVSGLQFTVDDDESLREEARSIAIADAKEKAQKIAEDLGVRIVRVVSFSEDNYYSPYGKGYGGAETFDYETASVAPQLPVGENKTTSIVYVTFEIR